MRKRVCGIYIPYEAISNYSKSPALKCIVYDKNTLIHKIVKCLTCFI